ncbi:MAG TPA: hypothetical protein ENN67_03470 [Firmicutes bacterium]|nr:hypothetical protein [Bacillota bacterium]
MATASLLLLLILCIVIYVGNKFLRDARGIRRELAQGKTLRELDDMVHDTRETLLHDYDEIVKGIDTRLDKLEQKTREAEAVIGRLENLLKSERLKVLEERGILFAIEAGEEQKGEKDRTKRIAELLRGGASVEEVARITESGVREVELVRLLIRRKDEAERA